MASAASPSIAVANSGRLLISLGSGRPPSRGHPPPPLPPLFRNLKTPATETVRPFGRAATGPRGGPGGGGGAGILGAVTLVARIKLEGATVGIPRVPPLVSSRVPSVGAAGRLDTRSCPTGSGPASHCAAPFAAPRHSLRRATRCVAPLPPSLQYFERAFRFPRPVLVGGRTRAGVRFPIGARRGSPSLSSSRAAFSTVTRSRKSESIRSKTVGDPDGESLSGLTVNMAPLRYLRGK